MGVVPSQCRHNWEAITHRLEQMHDITLSVE